jgi:vancomycin aglycone glucosyltransferase
MSAEARTYGDGSGEMRVLWSTYGPRADVEPMVALAVRLRALDAEVRVCVPPDFAELLARVGAPLVPVGQPMRPIAHGATPPAADLPRRAAELVAARFDTVAAAGEERDAPVATGVMPTGVWR